MRFIMRSLPMKRCIALRVMASALLVLPLTSVPTHAQGGRADIEIDFGACTPERRLVFFAFGSTTIEVAGKAGGEMRNEVRDRNRESDLGWVP
jgi:hypothetical protein